MKITRIDDYSDDRFSKDVLYQHGAYIIDDKYPCEFKIISMDSAIIYYYDYKNLQSLYSIIEEFRFYTKHIIKFYDSSENLIIEFDRIDMHIEKIDDLQPSQFYVNEEKLSKIALWAKEMKDFIIPIQKQDNKNVVLDGHTRLYLAYKLGLDSVYVFEDISDESIYDFANEAEKRNILTIKDLQKVSGQQYKDLWWKYCDDYFANKQ